MDFTLTRINPWYSGGCDGPPRVRLCALPYAGGTAAVFKDWPAALPSGVEMLVAHLPGRGDRFAEPPLATLEETAEQLCAALPPSDLPTVILGHSMGALLGYELSARLAARGRAPSLLIAAACRPPQVAPSVTTPATEDELAATLRDERPWDKALLSEELMQAVLPTLVADIAAGDRYHRPRPPYSTCHSRSTSAPTTTGPTGGPPWNGGHAPRATARSSFYRAATTLWRPTARASSPVLPQI